MNRRPLTAAPKRPLLLKFASYSFVREHKRLGIMQAITAGVDNRPLSLHDLVEEQPMTDHISEFEFDVYQWQNLQGYWIEEADVYAGGMKWRVHLSDPDPFPSSPHAHCIAGQERHVGCKIHLGTGVLYSGRRPWKKLSKDAFADLIEKIRPKFPELKLPLTSN